MDYYGDNVDLKGDQYWDIEWSHDILKRNMYNKYSSIHLIILLSCLKHHFSITLQILIIGVSCSGDCGMFLIKYVEYFMHDH